MGPMFNNQLKDEYASHTKLIQVKRNGDMKIEGEITQYTQRNKSVAADGRSTKCDESQVLTIRRSPYDAHIVKPQSMTYFSTLRKKMMWGADTRKG